MRIHGSILVATSLVATLSAQGVNCALLGTFNNHGSFNDVWGYTAPNGDEYALLGARTGTVVIDVTNPATPVETGWFPWATSTWRDIRTYGTYAYVVTEATAGFQIIDLTNPNNPSVVGVFGTQYAGNSHNICIDTGTGHLYLVGTNNGTPVFDLAANPTNPPYLGNALPGGQNANYFHDLCVENGYAYGSMIYNGYMRIMDATNPYPWTSLSNSTTPHAFTHNAWPNAAGTIAVTTDERPGGVVKFWDITNKSNPIGLGTFTPNTTATPHNAFIVGDKCHVSWYTEGYRCIDISDPNNPVEIASYDTYPGASGGYGGCWGCYPFLPSGNILASDGSSGLFIVKPTLASFSEYGQGCAGSVSQSLPCLSLNASGGSLTGQTNQYEYCYEVNAVGSNQITSFDIFTQSSGGSITRPAHIYADVGGQPSNTPLASTTITVGPNAGFFLATLAAPVTVNGTFYISYENSPGGVISELTGGQAGVGYYRTAGTGSFALSGLVDFPSYRIYCVGGSQTFLTPDLGNSGAPSLGSSYDVTLSDAVASSGAFILTGLSDTIYQGTPLPASIPGAPGCDVFAAPAVTQLLLTTGAGTASTTFSVPNHPSYVGLELFHQWAVLDAVNAVGIVVSGAGKATLDI